MLDFLWENKEWLFSGIGVALLAVLYTLFKIMRNRHKIKRNLARENVNNEPNMTVGNNEMIDSETKSLSKNVMPDHIMEAIKRLPLLQRKDAAKHYIGMFVSWRLPLLSISDDSENPNAVSIHLCDITKGSLSASVIFGVKRKEYPGLGLLNEDDIIEVEGRIEEVEDRRIALSDAKIRY